MNLLERFRKCGAAIMNLLERFRKLHCPAWLESIIFAVVFCCVSGMIIIGVGL